MDVWSLGIALATMLSGSMPFYGACSKELRRKILRGEYKLPSDLSEDARDLVRQPSPLVRDAARDRSCPLHSFLWRAHDAARC